MNIAADADDIVVVTQPGTSLSGRVVLSDGAPSSAPRMRIAFRRGDSSLLRSPDVEATLDEDLRFRAAEYFGPRLVRISELPSGWAIKAIILNGADITDVPTVFTRDHDGQLQVVLCSRLSTLEGEVRDDTGKTVDDAMVFVFSEDRK